MDKKILILGGNGLIGQIVSRQLIKDGCAVRIFTRNKEESYKIFGDKAEIVQGDAMIKEDIKNALNGCDKAHISLTYPAEFVAVKHITDLLKESRISKISYISGSTVNKDNVFYPVIRDKFNAENLIKQSGVKYQIFRPTVFMESLSRFVVNGRASILGKQEKPFHLVSGEEFARIVSERFQQEDSLYEQIFGPEAITLEDALKIFLRKNHPEIKTIAHIPYAMAKIISFLSRNKKLKEAINLFSYLEKVGEDYSENATICKVTVSEFYKQ